MCQQKESPKEGTFRCFLSEPKQTCAEETSRESSESRLARTGEFTDQS